MFIMQAEIEVTNRSEGVTTKFKNIKPSAVQWNLSVKSYADTCKVTLPLAPYLTSTKDNETIFSHSAKPQNGTVFHEGDYIEVRLGYNNRPHCFFKGFINQINYATPLELECEGYSYLLKDITFTKAYKRTTIRQILEDLTAGTEIKLSEHIPELELKNITFKNAPGLNVLEWFQKECLCVAYFLHDVLYVGASQYAIPRPTNTLRIGWNTVEDRELKKENKQGKVVVNLLEKSAGGEVKRTRPESRKYSSVRDVRVRAGLSDSFLKAVGDELQRREDYKGYKGSLTAFLEPAFGKGYVCEVIDRRFPERSGKYFVESVEGRFDSSGGRQKLDLIHYSEGDDRE